MRLSALSKASREQQAGNLFLGILPALPLFRINREGRLEKMSQALTGRRRWAITPANQRF